jgi:hypothetical protein
LEVKTSVLKYQIIEAGTTQELERFVRRWIDEGREPQGGIAAVYLGIGSGQWFYQAMIKEIK